MSRGLTGMACFLKNKFSVINFEICFIEQDLFFFRTILVDQTDKFDLISSLVRKCCKISTSTEQMVFFSIRWFQNSKVQKVVKDSKLQSKVRTSIKVKLNKPVASGSDQPIEQNPAGSSSSNPDSKQGNEGCDEALPSVIGSMAEYAKIVGKSVTAIQVCLPFYIFIDPLPLGILS